MTDALQPAGTPDTPDTPAEPPETPETPDTPGTAPADEAAAAARTAVLDARAVIRGRRQWPLPKQADPNAPLLVVEHLTTRFKMPGGSLKAVDDVSFQLNDGEALGIAGESGCGKTTTALSLVGLLPANGRIGKASSIKLFGIDLAKKSEEGLRRYRWREISVVFQGAMNALNPVRRVVDQIAEPVELRLRVDRADAVKRAGQLLEMVGIPAKRGRAYPHELSGGMRQRAMIAMALACDPAIVIGDEPTTALDVMVQAQILELLERLRRELGLSLILITHDLSVIAESCDRVLVMYAGKVAEEGAVNVIFRTPRHPYTQKLLGAFPNIHADRRTLDVIPGSPPDLRTPPPGCRFHPRCSFAMPVCSVEVPPEVTFDDGVRVACHLYPPGSDGVPITKPTKDAVAGGGDVGGGSTAGPAGLPGPGDEDARTEPVPATILSPGHGLADDHSLGANE
ncbi:MAG TPA: ABC transporter ATP-binding protein [Candidatus Acidoferrum sp.]|nr:ABC transporter ATP-binding protein [Candidatus Acidoferrum sp.]